MTMHLALWPKPTLLKHISTGLGFEGVFKTACFVCLLISIADVSDCTQVFDVTKYGAVAGGNDSSGAFLVAWNAACQYQGNAGFVIPQGTFVLGPVVFKGPCYNGSSPIVEIKGTLKALPNLEDFPSNTWIQFCNLNNLTVSGGGILDGQGAQAWPFNTCHTNNMCPSLPVTLRFVKVSNSTIFGFSLMDSKAFHIKIQNCTNLGIHDINITAPWDSPNTDGIHIGESNHINITSSVIGTGDDCISIGPGSTNIFVSGVTCGPGHGISVGSLGKYKNEKDVIGVHVENCTIMNTTNGVRIKTWPGSQSSKASNFTFEDIIMKDVSNSIIIDQEYCPVGNCIAKPSKVEISNVTFKKIRGTSIDVALNLLCSRAVPCKNIDLLDINLCLGSKCNTTSSCSNVNGSFSGIQILSSHLSCL